MSRVGGKAAGHSAPWDCVLSKDEEGECRAGARPASDAEYFEILCLCVLQAGLNWASIRKNWPKYREGFLGFRIRELALAAPGELLARPGVIKHPRKVEAIVHNAVEFERIAAEHGSFADFLATLEPLPEAARVKALAKRFKQIGPEAADYFLHAVGSGQ